MRTLKLSTIAENGERPIKVGYKAENEVSQIVFDCSKWKKEYGDGTLVLSVQRNGDAQPYPVELENNTWLITNTDLAHEGEGRFQVSYIVDEQVKRSAIFSFYVKDSMAVNGEAPDPYESWLDRIEEIAQNVTPVVTVSKEDNVATITVQQFEQDPQVVEIHDGEKYQSGTAEFEEGATSLRFTNKDIILYTAFDTTTGEEVLVDFNKYIRTYYGMVDGEYTQIKELICAFYIKSAYDNGITINYIEKV